MTLFFSGKKNCHVKITLNTSSTSISDQSNFLLVFCQHEREEKKTRRGKGKNNWNPNIPWFFFIHQLYVLSYVSKNQNLDDLTLTKIKIVILIRKGQK